MGNRVEFRRLGEESRDWGGVGDDGRGVEDDGVDGFGRFGGHGCGCSVCVWVWVGGFGGVVFER